MNSEAPEGVGQYQQGLLSRNEAVISSHFMHQQNLSDARLLTEEQFKGASVFMSAEAARARFIPLLQEAARTVVDKRYKSAIERAKRNYAQFGLKSADEAGTAEFITEALFDEWFRKGTVTAEDRVAFRAKVREMLESGAPIKLLIPMLPHKAPCPLKTRGRLPCMAEAGVLMRLGEMCGIIDRLRADGKAPGTETPRTQFVIVADGRRFKHALNTPEETISNYQRGLRWWIKQLGFQDSVLLTDYEDMMGIMLTEREKSQRAMFFYDALRKLTETVGFMLDAKDVEASLQKAAAADPFPESDNPEGRFVPLFKSMMYNIHYNILARIGDCNDLDAAEYNAMYRDMTRHLFTPFADLSPQKAEYICHYLAGETRCAERPSVPEIKEYVRRAMLEEAWQSTIYYLALVVADRALAEDPIGRCVPGAIRFSIHAKPGQIGLATDSAIASPVQAWHGSAVLRASGTKVKLSTDSCLDLESHGAVPVRISNDNTPNQDPNDLMAQFARSGQPIVYINPGIDLAAMREHFTHCR